MKVKGYEIFKCDAGWRTFSFLKLVTDDGIVGWSEYNESFGSPGLSSVIEALMPNVTGMDPMQIELVNAVLATRTTQSRGGIARQAIAAIENALLDIKGKALGVPVYELFGGKLRDRIPVYWSHCGSYRLRNPDIIGTPAVRTYDDMTRLGAEVKARGFSGLKTNIALEVDGRLIAYRPGLRVGRGFPERNWDDFDRPQRRPHRRGLPGRLRAGCRHHARPQLPLPHGRLPAHRRGGRPGAPDLARARRARSQVDRAAAPRRTLSHRLGRDPAGAARLPALLRGLCVRHRHRRRGLERLRWNC